MKIKLIKDENTSTTHWYLTRDDIFIDGSVSLNEADALIKYSDYILNNRQSNKITIICETTINEPNDNI
jgi:hypothetical protein